jgi:hypothetical protein
MVKSKEPPVALPKKGKRGDFGVIWSESINFDYLRH